MFGVYGFGQPYFGQAPSVVLVVVVLVASPCDTFMVPEESPLFSLSAESPTVMVPDEDPTFLIGGCG